MSDTKDLSVWMAQLIDGLRAAGVRDELVAAVQVLAEYASVAISMEKVCPGSKIGRKEVLGISLTTRSSDPTQTLAVLRVVASKQRYVTFCSGKTGVDAVRRLLAKIEDDSLRWQEDRPVADQSDGSSVSELPSLPPLG